MSAQKESNNGMADAVKGKARLKLSLLLLIWGLLFFNGLALLCQPIRGGFKYCTSYSTGLHPQNWCIVQDRRGIIYAGNNGGVLEYDGVSWRTVKVPNWVVRSLAVDDKGTVYVGGVNEIGFLAPDAAGALRYVSLLDRLQGEQKNFSTVWRINAAKGGVYFRAKKFLFRWNAADRQMNVWRPQKSFDASFVCGEKLFIHQRGVGLMQMVDDALLPIGGNETFASAKIYMVAPYNEQKILIGTRSKGFYIYDCPGMSVVPFPTEADDFLREKELYYGSQLSSGDFALATRLGGLAVIDRQGRMRDIFSRTSGLHDESVKFVCEDSWGNLWLALERGIAKIEYHSPLSVYDNNRAEIPGILLTAAVHGGDLYAGSTRGLYRLAAAGMAAGKFRPLPGISGNCWHLVSTAGSLLAATNNGVFQVDGSGKIEWKIIADRSYCLSKSRKSPGRVWVGVHRAVVSLSFYPGGKEEKGRWEEEYRLDSIDVSVRTVAEDNAGNLWLGTMAKGVRKVDFADAVSQPLVSRYDTRHGLPPDEIVVSYAAGHVLFASKKGLFRFDEKKRVFLPDFTLGEQFADGSRNVFRIAEDSDKQIWFHSEFRNFQAVPRPDGGFAINETPFLRIPPGQVNAIYPDPASDTVWFAGNDGLIRWDKTVKKRYRHDFPVLIRRVTINGRPIFAGYRAGDIFPIIAYKDRNVRFEFAAPFFEAESESRYRCFLQGYDDDWSAWSSSAHKGYTNLDAGTYTFRVQAKNVYGIDSREASFQFKVLPPWAKTWWAFLIYALAAFLALFLVVRWRSGKLVRDKQKLEQIIEARTREIADKSRQLEEQALQLKEMDRVKSRFFANISHEFRTPLTLIMGPIEQMLSGSLKNEQDRIKKLRLMLRNSRRLLNLINQLLELSKLESGRMKLAASRQDIVPFLKGITASFEVLAARRELELTFHADDEDIPLFFDAEKLEEVLTNLLANALKFTPAGGKIILTAGIRRVHPGTDQGDSLEISVSDTGPGIPREELAQIFDRFYQADSTYEHHRKGSGIGLALVKELVELHHGTIDVHNREGEPGGSEFIIRLPLGESHLLPDEIVDLKAAPVPGKTAREIPGLAMEDEDGGEAIDAREVDSGEKDIILVVEDSVDMRDFIKGALKPLYRVVEAADGSEGIDRARQIIPDLIVSDIMMPGVDGCELCKTLKQDVVTSHIPIILLTAKAAEESVLQGLQVGADDYITKPFNTRILLARIKNLIELRRVLQQDIQRRMILQPAKISASDIDEEFLNDLQKAIDKNLADPDFNVDALCKRLYLSRATLYRKVHALTGESPTDFIRSVRLKRGAELLGQDFGTVTEVAYEVGFSSAAYFTKCFKEKFQQLPSSFQAGKHRSS